MRLNGVLFVLAHMVALVHSQATFYTLNITAYQSFYLQNCEYPYSSSCAPFSEASLWIPEGVPDTTSTVVVNSTSAINLIIIPDAVVSVNKLSLVGRVNLIVEGLLSFYLNKPVGNNYSLIVCDDSLVIVKQNGTLITFNTALYDYATMSVDENGVLQVYYLLVNGSASLLLYGGTTSFFGDVDGSLQYVNINGAAIVIGYTLNVMELIVKDTPSIYVDIYVHRTAELSGAKYFLEGIYGVSHSKISIDGCANIYDLRALESSNITFYTDESPCTLASVRLFGATSGLTIIGNQNVTISSLYQYGGYITFVQTSTGEVTNISLPGSKGPGSLSFSGNFVVLTGEVSASLGPSPYIISHISVTGQVNVYALALQVADSFELVDGLHITLLFGGNLYVQNTTFNLDSANFEWSQGSTVWLHDYAIGTAQDLVVSKGRNLVINDHYEPTLITNSLTIEEGSVVLIMLSTEIPGDVYVSGALMINPGQGWATLALNGTLTVTNTGVLSLPQMMSFNSADPASTSTFLSVVGEAKLGGVLNITLGGNFVEDYLTNDIAILSAESLSDNFDEFRGSISKTLAADVPGKLKLSVKKEDNSVYLHMEMHSDSRDYVFYVSLGVVIGGAVLICIIAAIVVVRRRRAGEYTQLE